ncbi:unnamed protein product [Urochloa decumbens]|uniref:Uncharacterized protein n=1 Tax=Urochloa decumbens TaxID=240449 RepID=A0ABC9FMH7_9POAL
MIRRRFVNLVVDNYSTGERSLHRLDAAKHLFYPSTAAAEAAHGATQDNNGVRTPPEIGNLPRLPPPTMNLGPFSTTVYACLLDDTFVLLSPRTSDGRILHTSREKGLTHLYDAGVGSTAAIPTFQRRSGSPILLPIAGAEEEVEERVYAMKAHCGDPSFEVFNFSQHPHKWEPLPLPPFVKSSNIRCFTAIDDGHTICVSTEYETTGTYCFDTRSHEWRKAGDWVLPFKGRVDYVPELETWLGFSSPPSCFNPSRLCASSDLSAMDTQPKPQYIWPELQYVWEDLNPPREEEILEIGGRFEGTVLHRSMYWWPYGQHLVNLGGGRFCIAKVFQIQQEIKLHLHFEGNSTSGEEFVVLVGVEVVRDRDGEGGLRMVKHKSKRYVFTSDRIRCVL